MPIQLGDTFLLGKGSHLWVVISDPLKHAGEFVIVNLTTDQFRAGKECELNLGDHRWIRMKCYVSFGDARKVGLKEAATIAALMLSGTIISDCPMDSSVLQRIVAAAKKSKALPIGLLAYLD